MKLKIYKFTLISFLLLIIVVSSFYYFNLYFSKEHYSNVVLISIDALRADHLGCYGYERDTTPNIDKLSRKGTTFLNAISPGPGTLPSMISLMTSKYGPEHSVEKWNEKLNHNILTIPQFLKNNKIKTAFICAHFVLPKVIRNRKSEDWDFYLDYTEKATPDNFLKLGDAKEVYKDVKSWLEENKKKKFFLWIHFMEPHVPYTPPEPFNKLFVEDKYYGERKVNFSNEAEWFNFNTIPKFMQLGDHHNLDYYIAQYDGEIRYVDKYVGAITQKLKDLALFKETVIIILSDHGESLGGHNYFCHENFLYEELIKVPLIILMPQTDQKKRVEEVAETINLGATILDIMGFEKPEIFRGNSLLPYSYGRMFFPRNNFAFSTTGHGVKKYSIRSNNFKLVYNTEKMKYKLYDVERDPQEKNDVKNEYDAEFTFLKDKLRNWKNSLRFNKIEKKEYDKRTEELLKSLGYVE